MTWRSSKDLRRFLALPILGLSLALSGIATEAAARRGGPQSVNELQPVGAIPGQYIVVFKDSVGDPHGLAGAMARQHGLGLLHSYGAALKGFAAAMPDAVAQRVDRHGALADQQVARPVQHQGALLGHALDRHEAHVRPRDRLGDRRRIGRVVLLPLHVGLHVTGRD